MLWHEAKFYQFRCVVSLNNLDTTFPARVQVATKNEMSLNRFDGHIRF